MRRSPRFFAASQGWRMHWKGRAGRPYDTASDLDVVSRRVKLTKAGSHPPYHLRLTLARRRSECRGDPSAAICPASRGPWVCRSLGKGRQSLMDAWQWSQGTAGEIREDNRSTWCSLYSVDAGSATVAGERELHFTSVPVAETLR